MKTRWNQGRTVEEKITARRITTSPIHPEPPIPVPDVAPPSKSAKTAPLHAEPLPVHSTKKPGRKRTNRAPQFRPKSISVPIDLDARLKKFVRDQNVNVSAWTCDLIEADLTARGY